MQRAKHAFTVSLPPLTRMFYFSGYGTALCAEIRNSKSETRNKFKIPNSNVPNKTFWILNFSL